MIIWEWREMLESPGTMRRMFCAGVREILQVSDLKAQDKCLTDLMK